MKRLLILLIIPLISTGWLKAQEKDNLLKINALPLTVGNIALEYEKPITSSITLNGTLSWRPKISFPFKSVMESFIDDDSSILNDAKLGAFSITPEVRFYLSQKEAFKGFYIAPYIKYSNYNIGLDIPIEELHNQGLSDVETLPVSGSLNGFTAGFSVGAQWQLRENIFLDWRIIGPGYGFSNGKATGKMDLTPTEQQVLRNELDGIEDIPIMTVDYDVDSNGVSINLKGPFAGIRTALSIGYRF